MSISPISSIWYNKVNEGIAIDAKIIQGTRVQTISSFSSCTTFDGNGLSPYLPFESLNLIIINSNIQVTKKLIKIKKKKYIVM